MEQDRTAVLVTVGLVAALVVGGTGGAVAGGLVGTRQLADGAVTTPKLRQDAVTSTKVDDGTIRRDDLARPARGAQVVQYVAGNRGVGSEDPLIFALPGRWSAAAVADSLWDVHLVSDGPPLTLVPLDAGREFDVRFVDGSAQVSIDSQPYWDRDIDTIRITRTVPTSSVAVSRTG